MDAFPVSRAAEGVDTDHDDDHLKALHAVARRGRQQNPGDRRRRLMLRFLEKAALNSGDPRGAVSRNKSKNAYAALPSSVVVAHAARRAARTRYRRRRRCDGLRTLRGLGSSTLG
jgi:hypothetical protein